MFFASRSSREKAKFAFAGDCTLTSAKSVEENPAREASK
jgi:hypothetical protein